MDTQVSELAPKESFSLIINEGTKEQDGLAACPRVHGKWLEGWAYLWG